MQKLQNFLKTLKANCNNIAHISDEGNTAQVTISLGTGWAGDYAGGYWGDCAITDDELQITFTVGDVYDDGDFTIGEGIVQLTYKGGVENNGLAYTGELDKEVGNVLQHVTGGMLYCSGSEQGMQGHYDEDESYLSVDMEIVDNTKQKAVVANVVSIG